MTNLWSSWPSSAASCSLCENQRDEYCSVVVEYQEESGHCFDAENYDLGYVGFMFRPFHLLMLMLKRVLAGVVRFWFESFVHFGDISATFAS